VRVVSFTVPGLPAPWTSPRRGRGRGCIPTPASERAKAWQTLIRIEATKAMRGREKIVGPVGLVLSFVMGKDGPSLTVIAEQLEDEPGALLHTGKPDLTNLVKCAEDALKGIVFKDDCQVAGLTAHKFWSAKPGGK
jgi:Holliday junction resolvase RusA-like endonuclease